ncbi:MAG TPA: glycosyl hydrolase family 18 protein [Polyangiaceae bacterium]|nr:glycosyl hydrolase family 18 protein [Polyangiaceae bacterium]
MRQYFEKNWTRGGAEMPSHCSMDSFQNAAFRPGFAAWGWILTAFLCLTAACGPIGGVEDDSASSGGQAAAPTGTSAAPVVLPDPPAFKVVGYWPSWAGSASGLQFAKLNYIDYAFAIEAPDGSVTLPSPTTLLSGLVGEAHAAGVRVLLSIGGWNNGDDSGFVGLSGNADARTKFATTLDGYVDEFQLDGVDIDWEYPKADVAPGYTAMMQELSSYLQPKNKLITIAGAAFNGGSDGITADAIPYIDMVNIMAYDGDKGAGHSPYSFAQSALALWLAKGFAPGKAILGVPFYSQPDNVPYSTLISGNAAAAQEDQLGAEYYNGIPTIQAKTTLAMMEGGGMMAWDLSEDTHNVDLSLVSAIYSQIHASP